MKELLPASALPKWDGGAPGPHEYSTLDGLRTYQDPVHEDFFNAAGMILDTWKGNQFIGLYLYGTTGTGKTHGAVALGRALHDDGAEVHYRFGPTMYDTSGVVLSDLTDTRHYPEALSVPFPSTFRKAADRNPRSVLIFDEYQPDKQPALHASVSAAAQYGGLIVITSNYRDPFKPLEVAQPKESVEQALLQNRLESVDPKAAAHIKANQLESATAISASLRSRFAHEVKLIEMSGPDHRAAQSFWA